MAEEKKSVKFNLDNEIIPPVDKSKAPSVSGSDGTPVCYPSSAEVQPLRPEVQLKVPISPEDRQSVDDFHRLLAARQRALQLIGQAKQDKAVNLKRAQKEVQDDIDEYRAGMETDYQNRRQEVMAQKEEQTRDLQNRSQYAIEELNRAFERQKEMIVWQITDLVYTVEPRVHPNFKPAHHHHHQHHNDGQGKKETDRKSSIEKKKE